MQLYVSNPTLPGNPKRYHTPNKADVAWVASCTAGVLIAMMNENVDPAFADYFITIRLLLSAGF